MCYNCGCGNPHDDMGDQNNITEDTLKQLAEKLHISIDETKLQVYTLLEKQKQSEYKESVGENPLITEMFAKAAKAWGQPVENAKHHTYIMLKGDLKK